MYLIDIHGKFKCDILIVTYNISKCTTVCFQRGWAVFQLYEFQIHIFWCEIISICISYFENTQNTNCNDNRIDAGRAFGGHKPRMAILWRKFSLKNTVLFTYHDGFRAVGLFFVRLFVSRCYLWCYDLSTYFCGDVWSAVIWRGRSPRTTHP